MVFDNHAGVTVDFCRTSNVILRISIFSGLHSLSGFFAGIISADEFTAEEFTADEFTADEFLSGRVYRGRVHCGRDHRGGVHRGD